MSVGWALVILWLAVVLLGVTLSLMVFTGWWRGGPQYGYQEKRSWSLARWRGQAPAEEAEEREEVA